MPYLLKNIIAEKRERFGSGHRMCSGCAVPVIVRHILRAVKNEDEVVVANATGCLEVSSTIFPESTWNTGYIHTAFACSAATISGAVASYEAKKKKGKIDHDIKFLVFSGDGGTYDIGLQSLSGAIERGHDFTYICYDNGGYMNTGMQRSSATPIYASSTTTPVGILKKGKLEKRKDLSKIIVGHNIKYLGQTIPYMNYKDLYEKSEKAIYTKGPTFLNVFSPCPTGWKYKEEEMIQICKMAIETCYWPLYEVEDGKYKINYKPYKKLPIEEFLKLQGRFSHLLKEENKELLEEFQKEVDKNWEELLLLEQLSFVKND